jgi:branched-chain amino acid aminotransferase
LNIKVIEKNIEPYDVYTADEAFMTGTPFCMLPVTSLNGIKISDGTVGPTFAKLLKKWSANMNVDIEQQIKSWKIQNTTISPTPYQFKNKTL